jgi:hypothetical protein
MSRFAHIPPSKFFLKLRTKYRACYNPIFIRTVLFRSLLMILSTVLYGCPFILPVHKPGSEPFPVYKKDFAIVGYTTKDRVVEKLGNPSTSRLGERMYIYAGGQKDWDWVGGVLVLYYGAAFFGGSMPTYKTHLLLFEFDKNDVVAAIHTFSGDSGELESGFYVVNSGRYSVFNKVDPKLLPRNDLVSGVSVGVDRGWHFSIRNFILRAPKHMDRQSKQFVPPPNKAVIYYYKKFSDNVEVALDDDLSGDPGSDGFLMWVVDPGDHTVICPWCVGSLTLTCCAGEKYYLEHKSDMIRVEDKSIGEEEISKRSLVIDRLNTFDFDLSEYHNEFDSF